MHFKEFDAVVASRLADCEETLTAKGEDIPVMVIGFIISRGLLLWAIEA